MNMRYYLKEHCSILYKALGDMENSSGSNSTCEASMAHGSRYYFRQKQAFPSTWVKLTKSPCFFSSERYPTQCCNQVVWVTFCLGQSTNMLDSDQKYLVIKLIKNCQAHT